MHFRFFLFLLLSFVLAACGPVTDYPKPDLLAVKQEASIQRQLARGGMLRFKEKDRQDASVRLQRVAYRVLAAGAPFCGVRVRPQLSIDLLPDSTDYPKIATATKPPYHDLSAMPFSEAFDIKAGDRLLRINGEQIETGHGGYRRALDILVDLEIENDSADIEILRGGQDILKRRIISLPRCNYTVETIPRVTVPNAFADGDSIRFTTSMVRIMPTDDELAFIFGHELAHNMLSHASKSRIRIQLGYLLGAAQDVATGWWPRDEFAQLGTYLGSRIYSQDEESEADYVGVYLMASAGYDPDAALLAMRRLAYQDPLQIEEEPFDFSTHPSSAARAVAIRHTIDEVKEKLRRDEILLPELDGTRLHYEPVYPGSNPDLR